VEAVNDAPVAVNDSATTNEDTAVVVSVLANDSDVDGDTLTITSAALTSGSGTSRSAARHVLFTPATNFNGAASFSYTISDGNGGTATANGTITVVAVNDPPVAADDSAITNEDTAVTVPVLTNDTDLDGDTLTITSAALTSGQGTVAHSGNGSDLHPGGELQWHATITYTISDGNGGTDSAVLTVTITAVNDAPVAANDSATTNEDTAVAVPVLANDSDRGWRCALDHERHTHERLGTSRSAARPWSSLRRPTSRRGFLFLHDQRRQWRHGDGKRDRHGPGR
jgi:hypothetical protein